MARVSAMEKRWVMVQSMALSGVATRLIEAKAAMSLSVGNAGWLQMAGLGKLSGARAKIPAASSEPTAET